jgi:hypothetical protein
MMKRLLFSLVAILTTQAIYAQNIKYLHLSQKKIDYAPVSFYIKDIIDDRPDKTAAGKITEQGASQTAGVEGGGIARYLDGLIAGYVSQDKATQPVTVHIAKLNFDIKKDGGLWKTDAVATLGFFAGDIKLIEFAGKGHGETDADPGDYISGFLEQTLESDLKRFDGWWEKNKGNVATSSEVKINVTIGKIPDMPNSIVYSAQRPLQIADFEGIPTDNRGPEMAATLSGMGFGYATETQNGQLVANVTITPYFDRSQSWFKEAGKNPRLLAHEQLHFDITAIKACELAATVRNAHFTQENYIKMLDQLRDQNEKDTDQEETIYDDETKHGTIAEKQGEWEKKVKARVREVG